MLTNKKGFTLIELLIVVVIIGILAAIAIPKFANTKEKAYVTAMKSDLHAITTGGLVGGSPRGQCTARHRGERHPLVAERGRAAQARRQRA
jgi:prepilin-type N-terminal cleavage/methylation domain-containing protein